MSCKAITKSNTPCSRQATINGYCAQHYKLLAQHHLGEEPVKRSLHFLPGDVSSIVQIPKRQASRLSPSEHREFISRVASLRNTIMNNPRGTVPDYNPFPYRPQDYYKNPTANFTAMNRGYDRVYNYERYTNKK